MFEFNGIDNVKLTLPYPILNIDLDIVNGEAWETNSHPSCTVLDSNLDVTVSVTGFWGQNSTMQITVAYQGANTVGTSSFTGASSTEDDAGAVAELNAAIAAIMDEYLPTQGWHKI